MPSSRVVISPQDWLTAKCTSAPVKGQQRLEAPAPFGRGSRSSGIDRRPDRLGEVGFQFRRGNRNAIDETGQDQSIFRCLSEPHLAHRAFQLAAYFPAGSPDSCRRGGRLDQGGGRLSPASPPATQPPACPAFDCFGSASTPARFAPWFWSNCSMPSGCVSRSSKQIGNNARWRS